MHQNARVIVNVFREQARSYTIKVLTGGHVSNRGEQALLKQSTILMFAVAIAGIVTGVISGAQSILF